MVKRKLRAEIRELKRVLAEKTLEVDFFKGALQKIEARRQNKGEIWREGVYAQIRELMPMQGSLSIERMCQIGQVSRASFYRSLKEQNADGRGHGSAIGDSKDRLGAPPPLWLPAGDGRTSKAWHGGEPQASRADHARG